MKRAVEANRPRPARTGAAARRLVDLAACIEHLEATGNLLRVRTEVDPKHELAGIAKLLEGDKPVLFERVRGSAYPVFTGLLWNRDIVGSLFGMPKEQVPFAIADGIAAWRARPDAYPPRLLDAAPANEVVEDKVDLARLPIPVHALKDGGRYLDASVVVARNPETGLPNISIHRMMSPEGPDVPDRPGAHLGAYVEVAERRGEPLPVTINNGVGLAPWIVSTLPRLGDNKHLHRAPRRRPPDRLRARADGGRPRIRRCAVRDRGGDPARRAPGRSAVRGGDGPLRRPRQALGHAGEGDHPPQGAGVPTVPSGKKCGTRSAYRRGRDLRGGPWQDS
jgi:hypothetical protein